MQGHPGKSRMTKPATAGRPAGREISRGPPHPLFLTCADDFRQWLRHHRPIKHLRRNTPVTRRA